MDAVEFFKEKERMCKKYVINGDACMYTNCPIARELHSCIDAEDTVEGVKKMVEIVENWAKTHPVIILTEQQKTAIRGRIAEGYLWAVRYYENGKLVYFYTKSPLSEKEFVYETYKLNNLYDFVKTKPIYLPDLLGDEE